jgi:F0F1-type ATP synthase assembly protein I
MSSEEKGKEKAQKDDVSSRFFDPETDERLKSPVELPDPPKVNITRPNTKTANPNRGGEDGFHIKGETVTGGDLRNAGLASSLGVALVATIGFCTGMGYLADYLLKNKGTPWGLIIGFLFGVIAGFVNLIRMANKITNDTK